MRKYIKQITGVIVFILLAIFIFNYSFNYTFILYNNNLYVLNVTDDFSEKKDSLEFIGKSQDKCNFLFKPSNNLQSNFFPEDLNVYSYRASEISGTTGSVFIEFKEKLYALVMVYGDSNGLSYGKKAEIENEL